MVAISLSLKRSQGMKMAEFLHLAESGLVSGSGFDKFFFFAFPESLLGGVLLRLAIKGGLSVVSEAFLSGLIGSLDSLLISITVQLGGHTSSEAVVGLDSLSLIILIVSSRSGDILSDGSQLGDDRSKSLRVEGGGELDQREKWVGVTDFLHSLDDLFDFGELSSSSIVSLDVSEVRDDNI